MTVIITPVGTSLFNNGGTENTNIADYFANLKHERNNDWDKWNRFITGLRTETQMFIGSPAGGVSASAELQSTQAILNELNDITVHLIASDTIVSRLAAEILVDALPTLLGVPVVFTPADIIQGLCATDPNHFEVLGVSNLRARLDSICNNLRNDQRLAINITGGYAATVSLLTLFAQKKRCPLYYNFEDTTDLIEILRYFP